MSIPDFTRADYTTGPEPVTIDAVPGILETRSAFPRAVLFGLFGALVGALLYAIVGIWINIGFIAIIVGGMVGTAMMNGSGGIGGRKYQVAAVILTYFAVSLAGVMDILWFAGRAGQPMAAYIPDHIIFLVLFLFLGPFISLIKIGYGLIGLVILFFGMQAAWRTAKGGPGFYRVPGTSDNSTLGLR